MVMKNRSGLSLHDGKSNPGAAADNCENWVKQKPEAVALRWRAPDGGEDYSPFQFGNGLRFDWRKSLIRFRIIDRLRYSASIRRFSPSTSLSYHSSGICAAHRDKSDISICSARVSAGSNDSHPVTPSYTRDLAYTPRNGNQQTSIRRH